MGFKKISSTAPEKTEAKNAEADALEALNALDSEAKEFDKVRRFSKAVMSCQHNKYTHWHRLTNSAL